MTRKVKLGEDWEFDEGIENAISKNIKYVPYEGAEIDEDGILQAIIKFLKDNHYSVLKHEKS